MERKRLRKIIRKQMRKPNQLRKKKQNHRHTWERKQALTASS